MIIKKDPICLSWIQFEKLFLLWPNDKIHYKSWNLKWRTYVFIIKCENEKKKNIKKKKKNF